MQRKRAEQLGVFFHRVDDLLVTAEAMQVPLTDHQVGLRFLDAWLSATERSAFLAGLRRPTLKLRTLDPNAARVCFAELREELKSFCTGKEWQWQPREHRRGRTTTRTRPATGRRLCSLQKRPQLFQYSQLRNDHADLSEWLQRKTAGECFACLAGIHFEKGSRPSLLPCPFHGSSPVDPSDPRNVARAQRYGRDKLSS